MNLHLLVYRTRPSRVNARLFKSILAASLACAALFTASQSAAQMRIARDIPEPARNTATATPKTSAAFATLADAGVAAPVPNMEEASLVSPAANPFSSLEQDSGQSSSSQSSPSAAAPAKPAATKTKPPHHALGIALAALGTTALALGAVAYGFGRTDICANEHSGGCNEARDAGLVLMPVGGAVAVTGFYFQFHR